MKRNRGFASCIALALVTLVLLAAFARADTFTATFTNEFGDAIWVRDAHIGIPPDPDVPGNWSTGAYPQNTHAIQNPNNGAWVPGFQPLYDVVINIAAPCTLIGQVNVQTVNVSAVSSLNVITNVNLGQLRIENGQLTNNGTVTLGNGTPGGGGDLYFETSNAVLSGTGDIKLNGVGNVYSLLGIQGITLTHAATHLIHGLGTIDGFNGTGTLINNGTITADDPSGSLGIGLSDVAASTPNQNNGLIQAVNGAVLLFANGYIDQNANGKFFANGAGSIVRIGSARGPRITGGSLDTANGGLITAVPAGGGLNLVNVTNNGTFLIPHANNPVVVTDGLTNNSTITIGDGLSGSGFGTQLRFDNNSLLGGDGDVRLRGFGTTYGVANITISGGGVTLTHGADHLIHGYGTIDGYFGTGTLINNGTISGDDPAGDLQLNLNPNTPNQNNNLIQATNGGVVLFPIGAINQGPNGRFFADGPGSVVNLSAAGGQGVIVNGGKLETANGGVIRSKYSILRGSITNSGTFEMLPGAGQTLVEATTLTNNGTMTAASDSTFRFDANNTAIGGTGAIVLPASTTMIINGGQAVANGSGHTIKGNGTILIISGGSFTNNANLSPGLSPGKITVSGNYTQGSTGALNIEIGGHTPITQYDQLAVTGSAALNGTLNLSLINGFTPASGDTFTIITTQTTLAGAFTNVTSGGRLNNTDGTGSFRVDYNGANNVTLSAFQPSGNPTPTPAPTPARALNISTRLRVESGNNVLIGGFIITGSAPKSVAVRGIGPSLGSFGIPDALADPTLELHASNGALIMQNDDWQDDPFQAAQLTALGIPLQDSKESGMVATLSPSAYTAILAGKNQTTGVGLVEVYDIDQAANSQLANISTRGFVGTGTNVMIGGFILGGNNNNTRVAIRGIGPSLADFGISPVLVDPTLELHDGNGALVIANDNWQDDPASAAQLTANGIAPSNTLESGIFASLPPGPFTAVLAGKDGGTGIGLVEIYNLR